MNEIRNEVIKVVLNSLWLMMGIFGVFCYHSGRPQDGIYLLALAIWVKV